MRHVNNIKELHDRYGIEFSEILRAECDPCSTKIVARFFKNGKEIIRKVYKGHTADYVKFFGIEWFFD